jgi:hypothetical protein
VIYRTKIPYPESVQDFFEQVQGATSIERYADDGVYVQFEAEDDYDLHGQVMDLEENLLETVTIPRPTTGRTDW